MIVLVSLTTGLVLWIVCWSIGLKGFDAFLIPVFITLIALAVQSVKPFVDQILHGKTDSPG